MKDRTKFCKICQCGFEFNTYGYEVKWFCKKGLSGLASYTDINGYHVPNNCEFKLEIMMEE